MIKLYRPIFFAQGEDATDLLDMISEQGEADTLKFILDHMCFSEEREEIAWTKETSAGSNDKVFSTVIGNSESYQLSYSFHYNYVGVEETKTIDNEPSDNKEDSSWTLSPWLKGTRYTNRVK